MAQMLTPEEKLAQSNLILAEALNEHTRAQQALADAIRAQTAASTGRRGTW